MSKDRNKTGRTTRPFNYEDRQKISEYLKMRYSIREMHDITGRSTSALLREINTNGRRTNYDPVLAHQRAMQRMEAGYEKKRKAWEKKETQSHLHIQNKLTLCELNKRIENIEFQIEILIDTIKELQKKIQGKND